jgi:hypothetical protein
MNYNQNTYQSYFPPQRQPAGTGTYGGLKGRPVSSLEEVRASSIDFDGSVFFFPDLANKRIYTKQINMDGTALLNMYELKEIPVPQQVPLGDYITRKEFEEALINFKQALQQSAIPPQQEIVQQF